MKKKTTVELVEQSEKVSFYSISFQMDRTTEFERFLSKFEEEAEFNEDYQKILGALEIILDRGALERYFRPEGAIHDNLCALPLESGNIRLYCLRISDEILILGNGDRKSTRTYQEDTRLLGYALDLQKFDRLLRDDLDKGFVTIEERTLKTIEAENRQATPEEQEILSRYVGWGGIPQAFDERNLAWDAEYTELKSLLTDEEYEMARASTLNAHYTSPVVIRAMYDTVEQMGFRTGNILEPSCGVGNFFGLLPENMADSRLYGVELDSITGRIAQYLYPQADIMVTGFEKTDRRDFFDLAIGNVPFGFYKLSDKRFDKQNFLIHDYFFAKALDQVRPGGIVAFITSKGTMDKQSPEVRQYIAQRAELLGAIRLPNNAFRANAGTEVTSDIIFLQKREQPIDIEPDWVH